MGDLTHFDESGASRMVDVSGKEITLRTARASGCVRMQPATLELVRDRRLAKGDVLEVARLAGIVASKRTGELIPSVPSAGTRRGRAVREPRAAGHHPRRGTGQVGGPHGRRDGGIGRGNHRLPNDL